MSSRTRTRGERGSMAVELVMIAPMLLLLFGLIYAYGKTAQVHGLLDQGTRDAARSATDSRNLDEARQRAQAALDAALADAPGSCKSSAKVTVPPQFEAGDAVTVTSSCSYTLSDAGIPGVGFSVTPKSSFTSMLDPNRGLG